VVALLESSEPADRRRMLQNMVGREPSEVEALMATLGPTLPAAAQQLVELIVTTQTSRTAELLPIAMGELDQPSKESALAAALRQCGGAEIAALLRKLTADDANLLFFAAVREGNPVLKSVITALQAGTDPSKYHDPVHPFLLEQPPERFAPLVDGLRQAGYPQYVDAMMFKAAGRSRGTPNVAATIAGLHTAGRSEDADQLMVKALTGRTMVELKELVAALEELKQPAALAAAASWVRINHAAIGESNISYLLRQLGLPDHRGVPTTAEQARRRRMPWRRRPES
jgi:hypothetical protein